MSLAMKVMLGIGFAMLTLVMTPGASLIQTGSTLPGVILLNLSLAMPWIMFFGAGWLIGQSLRSRGHRWATWKDGMTFLWQVGIDTRSAPLPEDLESLPAEGRERVLQLCHLTRLRRQSRKGSPAS